MSDSVLNTAIETKFRLLLLFGVIPEDKYSQTWISAMDFLSIYGESFDYQGENLHGDSWMRFTEYAMRFWIIRDALHEMVLHGWLTAYPSKDGYVYQVTQSGKEMAAEFATTYVEPYRQNAAACYSRYGMKTGNELDIMIRNAGLKMAERRDKND